MKVLITGATGFVGSYLTNALLRRGHAVRILARSPERAAALERAGAEVRIADVGEGASLRGTADGIDVVYHLVRAPTSAPWDVYERIDVRGTEAMLAEAIRAGARRFIYAGTLAGYPAGGQREAIIDERSRPDESGLLGNYVRAKAQAEAAVLAAAAGSAIEAVIVRLGLVCGIGAGVLPAHVGQRLPRDWVLLFGDGSIPLPLVHIDNAVDALILAATAPGVAGESFNIVDSEGLTQQEYLALLRQVGNGRPRVLRLPQAAYLALGFVSEIAAAARKKEPTTTRYRIRTRLAHVRWDCTKARRMLEWHTRVPLREGLAETFRAYANNQRGG